MKIYGHYRWEDEPDSEPISTWTCAGWDEIENASAFVFLHPIYFIILWLHLDLAAKLFTPKLQKCFVASETSPTSSISMVASRVTFHFGVLHGSNRAHVQHVHSCGSSIPECILFA